MPAADVEFRDAPAEQAGSVIRGYAALYDVTTTIGGEYLEKIAPGAFTKTIANGDVVALLAHDWGRVLGRQSAGSLRLKDGPIGLSFELDADISTPSGAEAIGTVRQRAVKGCSFGFRVLWSDWSDEDEMPLRVIREIELYEISLLANPAYEATTAWVSSRANTNSAAAQRRIAARREAMRIRDML
ncbi:MULTISPECIES: HK97 family phage prohead protease [unclassified Bradyrhizobium]|uniref:HK97 family phage prohead protease n=1 Tax=unclassified Bradyrhizobium TaxID=2631580 RepID=UPI001FFA9BF5|nr:MULTISPECIES: HK97 family phage prohead protease [unclassified Bradyrhizobium]